MYGTRTSFYFVLLAVLTLSACSDEQEKGRKWCRKAAQVAGSLCLEGKSGRGRRPYQGLCYDQCHVSKSL